MVEEAGNPESDKRLAVVVENTVWALEQEKGRQLESTDRLWALARELRPLIQLSGHRPHRRRYERLDDGGGLHPAGIYNHEDGRCWFISLVGKRDRHAVFLHNVFHRYEFSLSMRPGTYDFYHFALHRSITTNLQLAVEEKEEPTVEQPLQLLMRKHRRLFTSRPMSEVCALSAPPPSSLHL